MKATPELAEAIKRLRTNTDFQVFMSALGDFGGKLVEQMVYAQETNQLRTLQGKAQAVTEILKVIDTAPDKFSK